MNASSFSPERKKVHLPASVRNAFFKNNVKVSDGYAVVQKKTRGREMSPEGRLEFLYLHAEGTTSE